VAARSQIRGWGFYRVFYRTIRNGGSRTGTDWRDLSEKALLSGMIRYTSVRVGILI
jgi:hypothetical protein